jgi:hypothetical protein
MLQEELHYLAAPVSGADHTQSHAIVGTQYASCLERGHTERSSHAGLRKSPS